MLFEKVQIYCSWNLKFTVILAFPTAENMPLLEGIGHKNTELCNDFFFFCISFLLLVALTYANVYYLQEQFNLSISIAKKKSYKELKKLKERGKKICYISLHKEMGFPGSTWVCKIWGSYLFCFLLFLQYIFLILFFFFQTRWCLLPYMSYAALTKDWENCGQLCSSLFNLNLSGHQRELDHIHFTPNWSINSVEFFCIFFCSFRFTFKL